MKIRNSATGAAMLAATLVGGAGIGAVMSTPMTAFAADTSTEAAAASTARSPGQWVTDALKGLVDKGTITQEQSDAVAQALEDARPEGGRGGHGHFGRGGGHVPLTKAAEVLNMSEDELRTALASKSLAQVAQEKSVDVQTLIDALVAERNAQIDQAVTDGRLTQAQADGKKADTVQKVTDKVNNVRPERGDRAPAASTSTTTSA